MVVCSFLGSGAGAGTPVSEAAGGALSSDATAVAPGGAAFSIWTLIYLGLIGLAVWQALPGHRANARQRQAGWWIAASMLLNATWILAVQFDLVGQRRGDRGAARRPRTDLRAALRNPARIPAGGGAGGRRHVRLSGVGCGRDGGERRGGVAGRRRRPAGSRCRHLGGDGPGAGGRGFGSTAATERDRPGPQKRSGPGFPWGAVFSGEEVYFSSDDDLPSRRRATMSCWICWVPSKMSRIFESRAHFSSSGRSE